MPNRLDCVDQTVLAVLSTLEGRVPPGVLARVQICLSEALYNLVIHAATTDRSRPVDIALSITGGLIGVELFDPVGAEPFDLRDHAPELNSVDVMAESGRGLALIMQNADCVDYSARAGRNRLRLGFDGAA